jgi:putative heme degradation protein
MELPIGDETQRGVLFYDQQGDIVFGVYLPGEGHTPSAATLEQFAATRSLIEQQPALCR